jgi:excisionase family DNA binding protein
LCWGYAMQTERRWYTTKDAAIILGLHVETVRRWCREGRIPDLRKVGSDWRIPDTWLLPELQGRQG